MDFFLSSAVGALEGRAAASLSSLSEAAGLAHEAATARISQLEAVMASTPGELAEAARGKAGETLSPTLPSLPRNAGPGSPGPPGTGLDGTQGGEDARTGTAEPATPSPAGEALAGGLLPTLGWSEALPAGLGAAAALLEGLGEVPAAIRVTAGTGMPRAGEELPSPFGALIGTSPPPTGKGGCQEPSQDRAERVHGRAAPEFFQAEGGAMGPHDAVKLAAAVRGLTRVCGLTELALPASTAALASLLVAASGRIQQGEAEIERLRATSGAQLAALRRQLEASFEAERARVQLELLQLREEAAEAAEEHAAEAASLRAAADAAEAQAGDAHKEAESHDRDPKALGAHVATAEELRGDLVRAEAELAEVERRAAAETERLEAELAAERAARAEALEQGRRLEADAGRMWEDAARETQLLRAQLRTGTAEMEELRTKTEKAAVRAAEAETAMVKAGLRLDEAHAECTRLREEAAGTAVLARARFEEAEKAAAREAERADELESRACRLTEELAAEHASTQELRALLNREQGHLLEEGTDAERTDAAGCAAHELREGTRRPEAEARAARAPRSIEKAAVSAERRREVKAVKAVEQLGAFTAAQVEALRSELSEAEAENTRRLEQARRAESALAQAEAAAEAVARMADERVRQLEDEAAARESAEAAHAVMRGELMARRAEAERWREKLETVDKARWRAEDALAEAEDAKAFEAAAAEARQAALASEWATKLEAANRARSQALAQHDAAERERAAAYGELESRCARAEARAAELEADSVAMEAARAEAERTAKVDAKLAKKLERAEAAKVAADAAAAAAAEGCSAAHEAAATASEQLAASQAACEALRRQVGLLHAEQASSNSDRAQLERAVGALEVRLEGARAEAAVAREAERAARTQAAAAEAAAADSRAAAAELRGQLNALRESDAMAGDAAAAAASMQAERAALELLLVELQKQAAASAEAAAGMRVAARRPPNGEDGATVGGGAVLAEVRAEASALARRVAQAEAAAAVEEAPRGAHKEFASASVRAAERLTEAERISAQCGITVATERCEAATLREMLGELRAAHADEMRRLRDELIRARADQVGGAGGGGAAARQVLAMTEALEACGRERRMAVRATEAAWAAEKSSLRAALRECEGHAVEAEAHAAESRRTVDERLRAQAAELRRDNAEAKRRARALLVEREHEVARLQAALRATPEKAVGGGNPADAVRDADEARANARRLLSERDEWHLRCIELHHAMRAAGPAPMADGLADDQEAGFSRLLDVAKQQAARDEELMNARVHVGELQAQLAEARSLHTALRERCAELDRQVTRMGHVEPHGGGHANLEYLKNVILQVFVMEDGRETLLPVVATFLQFSPKELQQIRLARERDNSRSDGGSFLGRLGEEWLFGTEDEWSAAPWQKKPPAQLANADADATRLGRSWAELEQSYRKLEKMRGLLFASYQHVEQYKETQARLTSRIALLEAELTRAGVSLSALDAGEAPSACVGAETTAAPEGMRQAASARNTSEGLPPTAGA